MKAPLALALIAACCGCDGTPPAPPGNSAAPPSETNQISTTPYSEGFEAGAPPPDTGNMSAPTTPGPARSDAGEPGLEPERFIVCPGDRRCPKR